MSLNREASLPKPARRIRKPSEKQRQLGTCVLFLSKYYLVSSPLPEEENEVQNARKASKRVSESAPLDNVSAASQSRKKARKAPMNQSQMVYLDTSFMPSTMIKWCSAVHYDDSG